MSERNPPAIIRGTTPTIRFNLPFNASLINKLVITFSQGNKILFEKTEDDCILTEKKVVLTLSQRDTLAFNAAYKEFIFQIRMLTNDGKVSGSVKMKGLVEGALHDGVI